MCAELSGTRGALAIAGAMARVSLSLSLREASSSALHSQTVCMCVRGHIIYLEPRALILRVCVCVYFSLPAYYTACVSVPQPEIFSCERHVRSGRAFFLRLICH